MSYNHSININPNTPLTRSLISAHRTKSKTDSNQSLRNNGTIKAMFYPDKLKLAYLAEFISIATREVNSDNALGVAITVDKVKQYLIDHLNFPNEQQAGETAEDLINIANIESPKFAGMKEWFLHLQDKTHTISQHVERFITDSTEGGLGLNLDELTLKPHHIDDALCRQIANNDTFELCCFFNDPFKTIQVGSVRCSIQDVKHNRFYTDHRYEFDKSYEVFKQIFITPRGIFANPENPITQAMTKAVVNLVKENKLRYYNYEIFKHVFITPRGIFANPENPITQEMTAAVTNLVKNDNLWNNNGYEIFEQIFITPRGIFANPEDPRTQAMTAALTHLVKHGRLYSERRKIFDFYIKTNNDSPVLKLLEDMLLNILSENELQEPEVINKITNRLANGAIDIPQTKQGIDFFVKLTTINDLPLIGLLSNHLGYFISKDGVDEVKKILDNVLLIKPLQQSDLEQMVGNQLIAQLQEIKENIDVPLIRDVVISRLCRGDIQNHVSQTIKRKIKECAVGLRNLDWQQINVDDQQIDHLFNTIRAANNQQEQIKTHQIKQAIKNYIFNNAELTKSQELMVNKLAKTLAAINVKSIQKQYIQEMYLQPLGITGEGAHELISNYSQWNKAIDSCRQDKFKKIAEQIISNDEKFKTTDAELYYRYVLNTLPYRSYANVVAIYNNNNIPIQYKKKLQLVVLYCQLNNFDSADETTLNLFVIEDKQTKETCLLSLQNLDYLNSKNIENFTLEQFKINSFANYHYTKLGAILANNPAIDNSSKADCSELATVLFNNLQQLKENNNLSEEMVLILSKFIETKEITKTDLNKIVNNDILKMFLKEVDTQPLGLNNFETIEFPGYLRSLISNHFTAGNIVAKHISLLITDIIIQNNFTITMEQRKKLEEICYQVALNLGKGVSLPIDFKKQLIYDLKDINLLAIEERKRFESGEIEETPAGDFIQVKRHLETELGKLGGAEELQLKKLPELLVDKAKYLEFTAGSDKLIRDIFNELNLLPGLTDKISKHEIAYMLGTIFMDMSSINVLGYHSGSDNTAFTRFRLLGAYWLAESICQNDNWTSKQKKAVSKEIKQATMGDECSGQIINRLYGQWHNKDLKDIYSKVKDILEAKAL